MKDIVISTILSAMLFMGIIVGGLNTADIDTGFSYCDEQEINRLTLMGEEMFNSAYETGVFLSKWNIMDFMELAGYDPDNVFEAMVRGEYSTWSE